MENWHGEAANVIFLVAGAGKADAIARAFGDEHDPVRFPTQGVKVGNGRLFWLLDEAAAQQSSTDYILSD